MQELQIKAVDSKYKSVSLVTIFIGMLFHLICKTNTKGLCYLMCKTAELLTYFYHINAVKTLIHMHYFYSSICMLCQFFKEGFNNSVLFLKNIIDKKGSAVCPESLCLCLSFSVFSCVFVPSCCYYTGLHNALFGFPQSSSGT